MEPVSCYQSWRKRTKAAWPGAAPKRRHRLALVLLGIREMSDSEITAVTVFLPTILFVFRSL